MLTGILFVLKKSVIPWEMLPKEMAAHSSTSGARSFAGATSGGFVRRI
jgi:hypothetical protein